MKRRLKEWKATVMFALALLLLVLGCAYALAEVGVSAAVGYDGAIFDGRFSPLMIRIAAGDKPIRGEVSVDVGAKPAYYDRMSLPVSLEAGETKAFRFPVRPMIGQSAFDITLTGEGGLLAETTVKANETVPENALVIGVIGVGEALAKALCELDERNVYGEKEHIWAANLDAETLPADERELSAFDALVMLDGALLSAEQMRLIGEWEAERGVLIQGEGASAQAVLAMIRERWTKAGRREAGGNDYAFGDHLNSLLPVDEGKGVALPAALLIAYTAAVGFGLYVLMKRKDRSKELWAAIPGLAAAMCALLAFCGAVLDLNSPMSSSVRVLHVDEAGKAQAQELALVNYAGQERARITTEHGYALGRMEYASFNSWTQMNEEEMALRDVITLGDAPAIELNGQATWLRRALIVGVGDMPDGGIEAECYVSEDGLHARIVNGLEFAVHQAALLTPLGFEDIGTLAPGEEREVLLARQEDLREDKSGQLLFAEGEFAPYQESLHRMASFAVDPERAQDGEFDRKTLPRRERKARELASARMSLAVSRSSEAFSCMLIGEIPDYACERLYIDGAPMTRSAQRSVLIREIPLVEKDGYFFYPGRTFARRSADVGMNGRPVLTRQTLSAYADGQDEVRFGFQLSGIPCRDVERIHVSAEYYQTIGEDVVLEVYNHRTATWQRMDKADRVTIGSKLAQQVIGDLSEVIFRYRGESIRDRGVRLPEIAVEGRKTEGGKAL